MFDFGFSEVLLTSVIALIVLGPEKLPRAASQVGRWVGRARAMARQFREQLEEEVNLEDVKKANKEEQAKRASEAAKGPATGGAGDGKPGSAAGGPDTGSVSAADNGTSTSTAAATPAGTGSETDAATAAGTVSGTETAGMAADGAASDPSAGPYTHSPQPADTPATSAPFGSQIAPDPSEFRADTFSHAHPTDEFGANPLTQNGAAEVTPSPAPSPSSQAAAELTTSAGPTSTGSPPRPDANEAYAPPTESAPEQPPTRTTSPTDAEKPGHA